MAATDCMRKTSAHGISYLSAGPEECRLCFVCVHGWACEANDYSPLVDELQGRGNSIPYRTIAVDLPGHGESSSENYPDGSLGSMIEALRTLIEELELENLVLVGHSMGMRAVLEYWHRSIISEKSRKVKGLVFLDGSHYKLRKSLSAFDSGDARSRTLSPEQKVARIQTAFKRMFSDLTPERFQAAKLARVRMMNLKYSEAMRRDFVRFDFDGLDGVLQELGRSDVSVLNLQSSDVDDENQRIPLKPGERSAWMEYLQTKVPQARQVVIKDSSHFPHVDQAAEVARQLLVLLQDV